ncbi:alkylphosphonate utilization protein [Pedobacter sp. SYP-B3415]|uniref:alkylphosphonate utilization protein n=1 Tax=Pedobacter sp. SYP-B3415 TaxID=2496641 RepID=UPI00101DE1B2|nr:alkylphosphonate utilization protein [Pedobacter sp. SYP-B3415]
METKDSNGNILNDGDAVIVNRSLKVKGMAATIKQGTTVKNIRLTNDPREVEGRIDKTVIVLKTEFLKKKA